VNIVKTPAQITKPGKSLLRLIKKRWKLVLIVAIVVGGFGYWQQVQAEKNQPQLKFVTPTKGNLTKTLMVSGVIDAKEKALLRFASGGKVVYLGAQEGEWVKKNQTIATIDRRELEKRLQKDLNAYMQERWDWEATQDATNYHVETLPTRRQIDKEQWDLNDTVLDVEIRDIAIRNTVITAPFAGVLVSSPIQTTGVQLLATEGFELVNPDTLLFKASVDESDIGQVKIGQKVSITLDAYPDQEIPTYVSDIAYKSSQSTTGTVFIVEFPVQVTGSLAHYKLGMNGDAMITIDTRENVLSVPIDATRQREDKTFVDVRTGPRTYSEREIEIDLETDDNVEVIKGLQPNEEILLPE
jgi:HlyD family secretion protein